MIRSEKTKEAFVKYLEEHPDERFWQSVRNFSGFAFIFGSDMAIYKTDNIITKYRFIKQLTEKDRTQERNRMRRYQLTKLEEILKKI